MKMTISVSNSDITSNKSVAIHPRCGCEPSSFLYLHGHSTTTVAPATWNTQGLKSRGTSPDLTRYFKLGAQLADAHGTVASPGKYRTYVQRQEAG